VSTRPRTLRFLRVQLVEVMDEDRSTQIELPDAFFDPDSPKAFGDVFRLRAMGHVLYYRVNIEHEVQ